MFTGIIETLATVIKVKESGQNKTFWVNSTISPDLQVDQSIAHDGICLTVESVDGNLHQVSAVHETLIKTTAGEWKEGTTINLERCMTLGDRLDGHMVQGHVDGTGRLLQKNDLEGSWEFTFSYPAGFAALMIEKGSITVNGISLTSFNVGKDNFTVAIIPYTYEHTNLQYLKEGEAVNLEFDMIGKYIQRYLSLTGTKG
jgi:riboflavin synthase